MINIAFYEIYSSKKWLSTNITTTVFNWGLLINIADTEHGFLLNVNVLCAKSLSTFTERYFNILIIKTV